jgi:hypothetical protein
MPVTSVNSNPLASQAALKGYQSTIGATGTSAQRAGSEAASGVPAGGPVANGTAPSSAPPTASVRGLAPVISNPFRSGVAAYVAIMNEQAATSMRIEA